MSVISPSSNSSGNTLSAIEAQLAADAAGGQLTGTVRLANGTVLTVKRKNQVVAASGTDTAIIAAVAGKKIRVLSVDLDCAATATIFTFNSKPAGAGAAIAGPFNEAVSEGKSLGYNPHGWFETVAGEGLSATTGSGSNTTVQLTYVEV